MRWSAILFAELLAVSWAAQAHASDAYSFVSEYIREISAIDRIRENAEHDLKTNPNNLFADCIRNSTKFQLELGSSIGMMKTFNLKPPVNDLPGSIAEFYSHKAALYKQMSEVCSEFLVRPQPNVDYKKLTAEMPQITAQLEFVDQALFEATPLIFAALIDERPDSQNHMSHLVITRAERDTLVHQLMSAFGPLMEQKNQNYIVSSGIVLKGYLTKDYKCADEPW